KAVAHPLVLSWNSVSSVDRSIGWKLESTYIHETTAFEIIHRKPDRSPDRDRIDFAYRADDLEVHRTNLTWCDPPHRRQGPLSDPLHPATRRRADGTVNHRHTHR